MRVSTRGCEWTREASVSLTGRIWARFDETVPCAHARHVEGCGVSSTKALAGTAITDFLKRVNNPE